MVVTTSWYLALAAVLFSMGAVGLLTRRNPLIMIMCVELMLNAVNLTFVSLGTELGDLGGQLSVFFVLVVAASEVVVDGVPGQMAPSGFYGDPYRVF